MNMEEYHRKIQKCFHMAGLMEDIAKTRGLKPIEIPFGITAPYSELCMHVGCAGRPVIGHMLMRI